MYLIIGGDQKEYGPITADELRQWIAEGRLNAQSRVKAESDAGWRPLSAFPEFANSLAAAPAPSAQQPPPLAPPADWLERDYHLDIGGCLSRGFDLLKSQFGVVFVAMLLFIVIEFLIAGLGAIPFIGPVFSLANLFIAGPLLGGVFYVFLQAIRRRPTHAGEVFMGFRRQFIQLFLGKLVSGLLAGLCMIPFIIVWLVLFFGLLAAHQARSSPLRPAELLALLPIAIPVFLICLVPTIYLQVRWVFTLPLIIDRQMDFWTAMKASWKMVGKHWWSVFALFLLIGLLNLAGFCVCCVGVLFTAPVGYGALMYAYETIFSESATRER
ncbi:MAG TPA: DUF975 family protein [Candidatus Acidoferrum sp.]|nr:DUF975 family protein [Candidatus Acidoferrum sp.]